MIPAFSPAMTSTEGPSSSRWSSEMDVMAQATGEAIDVCGIAPSAEADFQDAQIRWRFERKDRMRWL